MPAGEGQEHADLAVLDAAGGPGVSPLYAGGPAALLEGAGLAHDQHALGSARRFFVAIATLLQPKLQPNGLLFVLQYPPGRTDARLAAVSYSPAIATAYSQEGKYA